MLYKFNYNSNISSLENYYTDTMKVVTCEKCGAKYQIDNNETVNNYECSVCTGNLKEVEEYPSTYASINQNHSKNLYKSSYNPNSQIIYCENCGLKHTIDKTEYPENYQCSSCFGNLKYVDEDLNKDLEKRLKLKQDKIDLNSKIKSNSKVNSNIRSKINGNSVANETNNDKTEKKLRIQIKNEFYNNLATEYEKNYPSELKNDNGIIGQKTENIEDRNKKIIDKEESKKSIFDRIANQGKKEKIKDETHENIVIDNEIAELNNPSTTNEEISEIIETYKKKNKI